MRTRGFTLIEILVTILLTLLILGAVYYTYKNLFGGSKVHTSLSESEIEKVIGAEIIRLDIEHAGFGIMEIEDCPSVRWGKSFTTVDSCDKDNSISSSKGTLIIRSMINNTNSKEIGWVYVDCTSGSWPTTAPGLVDERLDKTNNNLIFIDATSGNFKATGSFGVCPGNDIYLAYPYDNLSNMDNCTDQVYCHKIVYRLSSTTLDYCHPNTKNLLRGVDGKALSGGDPILSCVADFKVLVDIDSDNDGITDMDFQDFNQLDLNGDSVVSSDEVFRGLKKVHIYILLQAGKKDKDFRFPTSTLDVIEPTTTISFNLPSLIGPDYIFYRWKVVKISAIPMNLRK